MRTFKFLLVSLVLLLLVTVSCDKQEAQTQTAENLDNVEFFGKNAADEQDAMDILADLEAVDQAKGGDAASKDKGTGSSTAAASSTPCCDVSSISLIQWTPTFVNLNIQFTMGPDDLEVRVLHYIKDANNSWSYYGYSKVINNDPSCIEDGVNMGTMHLPSGEHLAIARVRSAISNSWCGSGSNFLFWTNP